MVYQILMFTMKSTKSENLCLEQHFCKHLLGQTDKHFV